MSEINNVNNSNMNDLFSAAESSGKAQSALGQEDFLKLLVTQMTHQDPMEPEDPGAFLGQLAQFGTVDGISRLNQSMGVMNAGLYSNQALQASTLVGRNVQIESNVAVLTENNGLSGAIEVPDGIKNVRVSIEDSSGEVVKELYLGDAVDGTVEFKWDGIGNENKAYGAGQYTIKAEGDQFGKPTGLKTYAVANVDSVTLGQGDIDIALNLNGLGTKSLYDVEKFC